MNGFKIAAFLVAVAAAAARELKVTKYLFFGN